MEAISGDVRVRIAGNDAATTFELPNQHHISVNVTKHSCRKKTMSKIFTAMRLVQIYFYYTARPKRFNPLHYLRQIREGSSVERIRRQYPDLYKEICGLLAKSGSTGGEWTDYLTLYEEIRSKKPRKVLEFGSGISSLVISYAITRNAEETGEYAQFFSIEENEYYHCQIKDIFPSKYADVIDFKLRSRVERQYGNLLGCYYDALPKLDFDFIFIDGPTERATAKSKKCFNADLVNLIESNTTSNFSGLLDQRITTYWALKKLLPDLRIKYSATRKLSFLTFSRSA